MSNERQGPSSAAILIRNVNVCEGNVRTSGSSNSPSYGYLRIMYHCVHVVCEYIYTSTTILTIFMFNCLDSSGNRPGDIDLHVSGQRGFLKKGSAVDSAMTW